MMKIKIKIHMLTHPKQHAVRNAPNGTRGSFVNLRLVRSHGVSGNRFMINIYVATEFMSVKQK